MSFEKRKKSKYDVEVDVTTIHNDTWEMLFAIEAEVYKEIGSPAHREVYEALEPLVDDLNSFLKEAWKWVDLFTDQNYYEDEDDFSSFSLDEVDLPSFDFD